MARASVIGLDGAAWHLLDPMIERGVMPRLEALKARGAWGTLRSTVPTYTPPAWTSAATGVNPGRHGIYGFVEGHAQAEKQALAHAGKVRSSTIWEMANAQGARAGIYNLPLTYPPQPLDGWMVAGMMTPGYGERQRGFASWGDPHDGAELEAKILEWAPGYVLDISANYETDWKDEQLAVRALDSIRQRRVVLDRLLETDPVDIIFSVLEAPDRLQHVYYRYMDPSDEYHSSAEAQAIRERVDECFAEMDTIIGLLEDRTEGGIVLCSDHGFTAWEVTVHLNALLGRWGYFNLKASAAAMRSPVARALVPLAKKVLPRKIARDAKGKTFSAVEWGKTRAFASPIPQQGIFINVAGRDRFGIVPPRELDTLKTEIKARLEEATAPDGRPLCDKVWRSEEVFHGDAIEGAPDLLPVMRDHRYENSDEIFHKDPFSDVAHMPRGVHHPDGVVIVAGPGVEPGKRIAGDVQDVTPTLLYQAGLAVPEGLDGKVLTDAFSAPHLESHPVNWVEPPSSSERDESSPYSAEEEAMIEESLKGLGYL